MIWSIRLKPKIAILNCFLLKDIKEFVFTLVHNVLKYNMNFMCGIYLKVKWKKKNENIKKKNMKMLIICSRKSNINLWWASQNFKGHGQLLV